MEAALTFNEISFTPVTHQNRLWIRAAELARALGYSSEEKVSRVYRRNADEFTADMTQVIEKKEPPGIAGGSSYAPVRLSYQLRPSRRSCDLTFAFLLLAARKRAPWVG